MEAKYIVAIAAIGLFAILFLIFFMLLAHRRKMEAKLQAYIHEMYADRNLIKADYDTATSEDAPQILEARMALDGLSVPKQEEHEETQLKMEEVFGKMEIEGIEEITGNYQP